MMPKSMPSRTGEATRWCLGHDPEKWIPVSRLRDALARLVIPP
jgi:hypothetical protein